MNETDNGSCVVPLLDSFAPPADDIYPKITAGGRAASNLYRALAHTPHLLRAWVDFAWPLRKKVSIPRGDREVAIAYLARRRGSEYVRVHHSRFAAHHGITESQLDSLNRTPDERDVGFSDGQTAAMTLVDDVVANGVATPGTLAALEAAYGREGMIEMLVTVAFYETVCVVNRSLRIPVEEGYQPSGSKT